MKISSIYTRYGLFIQFLNSLLNILIQTEFEFRQDFEDLIHPNNPDDDKLRENLIWKIKKICDEYELSDDTFFRTVFIYDFQHRVKAYDWEKNWILENK